MEPVVPLQFTIQINARTELIVLATGLHQANLVTTVDIFDVNGTSEALAPLNGALVTALETAIQNLVISNQAVPV